MIQSFAFRSSHDLPAYQGRTRPLILLNTRRGKSFSCRLTKNGLDVPSATFPSDQHRWGITKQLVDQARAGHLSIYSTFTAAEKDPCEMNAFKNTWTVEVKTP